VKTQFNPMRGLYKLLGRSEECIIEIGANATVKVTVGSTKMVLPLNIVMAIQSKPAIDYLRDPAVSSYLFAANERETRNWAARTLVNAMMQDSRRDFVRELVDFGLSETEAWVLARLKHPPGSV
jgi:hypothetical protein